MAEHMPGAAVRRIREAQGVTLRAFAKKLGVSAATLSGIETGRTEVTLSRLSRIADLLGVSVAALLAAGVPVDELRVEAKANLAGNWREFADLDLDPIQGAALSAFVARGFHATTMREIAAAAGLSVAGVYHHYASKTQILVSLLDLTMSDLRTRVLAARSEGTSPLAGLALMVEALALFHVCRPELAFLGVSEMRGLDPENRARITGLRDEVQHLLDDQAGNAIAVGELHTRDPRTATRAIATLCTSLPSWFRPTGSLAADEVARQYAEYAVALMRVA